MQCQIALIKVHQLWLATKVVEAAHSKTYICIRSFVTYICIRSFAFTTAYLNYPSPSDVLAYAVFRRHWTSHVCWFRMSEPFAQCIL